MIELPIINSIWEKYTKDKNVEVFVEKNFYDEVSIRKVEGTTTLFFPNGNDYDKLKIIQSILKTFDIPFTNVLNIFGNKIENEIIFCYNEKWYSFIECTINRMNEYEIRCHNLSERIFITKQ